eukprot:PhM_4_TR8481/c1_g1_i2/m.73864
MCWLSLLIECRFLHSFFVSSHVLLLLGHVSNVRVRTVHLARCVHDAQLLGGHGCDEALLTEQHAQHHGPHAHTVQHHAPANKTSALREVVARAENGQYLVDEVVAVHHGQQVRLVRVHDLLGVAQRPHHLGRGVAQVGVHAVRRALCQRALGVVHGRAQLGRTGLGVHRQQLLLRLGDVRARPRVRGGEVAVKHVLAASGVGVRVARRRHDLARLYGHLRLLVQKVLLRAVEMCVLFATRHNLPLEVARAALVLCAHLAARGVQRNVHHREGAAQQPEHGAEDPQHQHHEQRHAAAHLEQGNHNGHDEEGDGRREHAVRRTHDEVAVRLRVVLVLHDVAVRGVDEVVEVVECRCGIEDHCAVAARDALRKVVAHAAHPHRDAVGVDPC